MYGRILSVLIIAICISMEAGAQAQNTKKKSVLTANDSIVIQDTSQAIRDSSTYRAIEKYSQKSKITRFIHDLIFKHVTREEKKPAKKSKPKKAVAVISPQGKIIRKIRITTLNPFGYSLRDTTLHPKNFVEKAGNSVHVKSLISTIDNLLLFDKYTPYDSLLVNESLRLLRTQQYIRDVYLYTSPVSKKSDSIDVYIRVSDIWSLIPTLNLSTTTPSGGLTENNFAGLGHSFGIIVEKNIPKNINMARLTYLVPNIRNSYINVRFQYLFSSNNMVKDFDFARSYYSPLNSNLPYIFSENKDITRSIEISRPFYTPLVKWAGGIFFGQMITAQSNIHGDTINSFASKTNIQDFWVARSWQLYKWNDDDRITSFILSGRIVNTRYPGRPANSETANIFNNETSYLLGIGISSRKYISDRFIFNYGKTEDVPVGRIFGITLGMDVQDKSRMYLGLKESWGDYYRFGSLSTDLEFGTFIGSSGLEQGVVTTRVNYYTPLLNFGQWKLRQFVRPAIIVGINRLPNDNLTLNGEIKGFEKLQNTSTRLMVLTLQTQTYSPWNLFGFNFGPYLFSSFGMLGNSASGFSKSKLYTLIGVGILIKNNYLTFNTFQVSITFYPYIPPSGYDIFKLNAYKTSDYGFMDFNVSKPGIVEYR